jgi:putative membrane protein
LSLSPPHDLTSSSIPTETPPWRRLAPLALGVILFRNIQSMVRQNLSLFAGAGAGVAFLDWITLRGVLFGGGALLGMTVLGAILYHQRFRFRIEADAVRVRKGVLVRREVRIPLDRIQNVRFSEPLYFRPFGLVRLALETPGASETEVELPGIPRSVATALRDQILKGRAQERAGWGPVERGGGAIGFEAPQTVEREGVTPPSVRFSPSPWRIFLYGAATNRILLVALAYLGYAMSVGSRQMADWEPHVVDDLPALLASGPWSVIPIPALVAAFVLLVVVGLTATSGVLALFRYHHFVLEDQGDRLLARAGLLERSEQALRREKIRGLRFRQSPLGRLLGIGSLMGTQATGSAAGTPGSPAREAFLIPGLRLEDFERLAPELVPLAYPPPRFTPISPRFQLLAGLRVLPPLTVAASMLWVTGMPASVALSALFLAVLGVHLRWRGWGWGRSGSLLWVRRGMLGREIEGFNLDRVQGVAVRDSPGQRRHGLATLDLTLPQGTTTVPFMPRSMALLLANEALFRAETAKTHEV